jgi:3-deoxy-D-manno-octulosonic-acid transferase
MRSPSERIRTGPLHKLYSAGATVILPVILAGLVCFKRGRRRLGERFGGWGEVAPVSWWLHGASVGEVQGLLPLIRHIKSVHSEAKFLLTATSPTGLERGAVEVDQMRLAPLDSPLLVTRALSAVRFDRFIVTETELWPNMLRAALESGKPCHIVNGRISDYTSLWYARARAVFSPLLTRFTSISVPDETQRERFLRLGVDPAKVYVTGHTKYDTHPRFHGDEQRRAAREAFFPGLESSVSVITLGSIRNGEENYWFRAIKRVWERGHRLKVIVAPRHAERFEYFWKEMQSFTERRARWSAGGFSTAMNHDVLLLDTMGLLEQAYAASDLAFVGATMVDIGGHNPFEPAMYGVPVVVGQYTSVIEEQIAQLAQREAVTRVKDEHEIYNSLELLCRSPELYRQAGQRAKDVWAAHQGSAARVLQVIVDSEGVR